MSKWYKKENGITYFYDDDKSLIPVIEELPRNSAETLMYRINQIKTWFNKLRRTKNVRTNGSRKGRSL